MRIHIVSLPHTLLTKSYDWCAYTAKVRRFVTMLAGTDHEAFVYGPDVHECDDASEYIPIVHEADRQEWFGSSEWPRDQVFDRWDAEDPLWRTTNRRAVAAIGDRWTPDSVVGIIAGTCQQQILDGLADLNPVALEWGIGYSGVLSTSHKVWESYAWAHHVAGRQQQDDIRFFDTIIPNCYSLDEFAASETPGDYLLFMGRPTYRKGIAIVEEIVRRTDIPVKIAGQPGVDIPGTEHVGLVLGDEKAELLAGARATLVPTTYLEPFGGVAVESMLSGTPVISTDWGAFTETVQPGISGYRCRMLQDFLDAVEDVTNIDRVGVRAYAEQKYSLDVGRRLYDRFLNQVATLPYPGWYSHTSKNQPAAPTTEETHPGEE